MSQQSTLRSWVHKHCGNVLVDGNTQYCCTVKISTKTVVDGVETSSFKLCGHPLNRKKPSGIAAHLKTHGLEAPDKMIRLPGTSNQTYFAFYIFMYYIFRKFVINLDFML